MHLQQSQRHNAHQVRAKERRALQAEALQGRTQAACARLQGDIQGLKAQKVGLQKQAEAAAKAFAAWRKDRERELATLRRQVSTHELDSADLGACG